MLVMLLIMAAAPQESKNAGPCYVVYRVKETWYHTDQRKGKPKTGWTRKFYDSESSPIGPGKPFSKADAIVIANLKDDDDVEWVKGKTDARAASLKEFLKRPGK